MFYKNNPIKILGEARLPGLSRRERRAGPQLRGVEVRVTRPDHWMAASRRPAEILQEISL